MNKLHSGAKWSFRFKGYATFLFLVFFLSWAIIPTFGFAGALFSSSGSFIGIVVAGIISYLIFAIIVSEIYARMAYSRWFYEFTNTNLKIEKGIIWKKYSNVPYERVQNVDIHRGILARMFGFSSVADCWIII